MCFSGHGANGLGDSVFRRCSSSQSKRDSHKRRRPQEKTPTRACACFSHVSRTCFPLVPSNRHQQIQVPAPMPLACFFPLFPLTCILGLPRFHSTPKSTSCPYRSDMSSRYSASYGAWPAAREGSTTYHHRGRVRCRRETERQAQAEQLAVLPPWCQLAAQVWKRTV